MPPRRSCSSCRRRSYSKSWSGYGDDEMASAADERAERIERDRCGWLGGTGDGERRERGHASAVNCGINSGIGYANNDASSYGISYADTNGINNGNSSDINSSDINS